MKSLTFNFGFIVSSYKLSLLRSLLTLDIFLLDMSHEIKPHWETIGYSSMNVPLLLRAFVCKVFCARTLAIPTKTGSPFYAPATRISSVYYLGLVAVTHLCGIFMPHVLRVSVQVYITGQLIQNWCTSAHGVPQKLKERLYGASYRKVFLH